VNSADPINSSPSGGRSGGGLVVVVARELSGSDQNLPQRGEVGRGARRRRLP